MAEGYRVVCEYEDYDVGSVVIMHKDAARKSKNYVS